MSSVEEPKEQEQRKVVTAKIITHSFVGCPHCGESTGIDAVAIAAARSAPIKLSGPIYCDECDGSFNFNFSGDEDEILLEPLSEKRIPTLDLLELPPQPHPVFLVVSGKRRLGGKNTPEARAYLYNENQCPTNWVGDVERIIYQGDTDPHGLFRFVKGLDTAELMIDGTQAGHEEVDDALHDRAILKKHFPMTVIHPTWMKLREQIEVEGTDQVNAFVKKAVMNSAVWEDFMVWKNLFVESMLDRALFGDKWQTDLFLNKPQTMVTNATTREVHIVAVPKDHSKTMDTQGNLNLVRRSAYLEVVDGKFVRCLPYGETVSGDLNI